MGEIAGIKTLIREGKSVTHSSMRSTIASARYRGITGILAFDRHANDVVPLGFGLCTCDLKGEWHYWRAVG